MDIKTSLLFRLKGNDYRQVIKWQQQVDMDILRHQLETRGQALVMRLGDQVGMKKIIDLPALGEADPYYGAFGGAYRYTFHPLSEPKTGPLSMDQAAPLTKALLHGCEVEICNQMGGFAYFYPTRISPLRLCLANPPELQHVSNESTRPLGDPLPDSVENDSHEDEIHFRITTSLYSTLMQWGWYGRALSAYDFIFIPTTSSCLTRVRMRESGAIIDLVKESSI
jgi:hypothetical protein